MTCAAAAAAGLSGARDKYKVILGSEGLFGSSLALIYVHLLNL